MYLYGKNKELYEASLGKVITGASCDDDRLLLTFEDGTRIKITDEGQSCCEYRYITCDDDPADLIAKPFAGIVEKEHDTVDADYDVHETMFVEVKAGLDNIVMTTHNEHNGYYGGFSITVSQA